MKSLAFIIFFIVICCVLQTKILDTRAQIEEIASKNSEVNVKGQQQNLVRVAEFLSENSDNLGQPLKEKNEIALKNQEESLIKLFEAVSTGDPGSIGDSVHLVIKRFLDVDPQQVEKRIALIQGVLEYPSAAAQPEFKQFLLDFMQNAKQSNDASVEALTPILIGAYNYVEVDPEKLSEFRKEYSMESFPQSSGQNNDLVESS